MIAICIDRKMSLSKKAKLSALVILLDSGDQLEGHAAGEIMCAELIHRSILLLNI